MPVQRKDPTRGVCSKAIIGFIIFLFAGCSDGIPDIGRKMQGDSIPPVFIGLQFPEPSTLLNEGELVITGRLYDTAQEPYEPGFDPEFPVWLEIETLGEDMEPFGQMYPYYLFEYKEPNPSYFDWQTGNFRIEFGDYKRLKKGNFILTLYGKDANGNISDPVSASVYSSDIEGADPDLLYQARADYGAQLISILEAYKNCLEMYGSEYADDITIIEILQDFFENIYINSPNISTWQGYADELLQDLQANPHSVYSIQQGMEYAVGLLRDESLPISLNAASYPFYWLQATRGEIIEKREKLASWYYDDVEITDTTISETEFECHIVIREAGSMADMHGEDYLEVANFTIHVDTNSDLEITGYIGYDEMVLKTRVQIGPSDYDPPIKFLKLFYDTCTELLKTS